VVHGTVAKEGNVQPVLDALLAHYETRETELTADILRQLERYLLLNAIDGRWKDHLHAIDALKAGIGLRGYGQVDPKTEYKREGFQLFEQLLQAIEDEVTSLILRIKISRPDAQAAQGGERQGESAAPAVPQPKGIEPSAAAIARARAAAAARARPAQFVPASRAFDVAKRQQVLAAMQQKAQERAQGSAQAVPPPAEDGNASPAAPAASSSSAAPAAPAPTPRAAAPKAAAQREHVPAVGRNDPCPCGSGQKYKKCHGKGA